MVRLLKKINSKSIQGFKREITLKLKINLVPVVFIAVVLIQSTHYTSVIRRIWFRRRSGALKPFESIRKLRSGGILGKLCISIRTKIMVRKHMKKWSGVSNSWSGTRFHWSEEKMLVFWMTEVSTHLPTWIIFSNDGIFF